MDVMAMVKTAVGVGADVAEVVGVSVILIGVVTALLRYAAHPRTFNSNAAYDRLRRELGRSIIVGLEFLVAADIVHTVVIDRTLENIGLLAVIVMIRILLSFSLFVEVEGRWPWQPGQADDADQARLRAQRTQE